MRLVRAILADEEGQDLAEYGMLIGFIAVVVVAAVGAVGQGLLDFFNAIANRLDEVL